MNSAMDIQLFQQYEQMALRYSELAYNEACKPKAQQNQVLVSRYLRNAKTLTKYLIRNNFWQERN